MAGRGWGRLRSLGRARLATQAGAGRRQGLGAAVQLSWRWWQGWAGQAGVAGMPSCAPPLPLSPGSRSQRAGRTAWPSPGTCHRSARRLPGDGAHCWIVQGRLGRLAQRMLEAIQDGVAGCALVECEVRPQPPCTAPRRAVQALRHAGARGTPTGLAGCALTPGATRAQAQRKPARGLRRLAGQRGAPRLSQPQHGREPEAGRPGPHLIDGRHERRHVAPAAGCEAHDRYHHQQHQLGQRGACGTTRGVLKKVQRQEDK